jgi:hypothetical protein
LSGHPGRSFVTYRHQVAIISTQKGAPRGHQEPRTLVIRARSERHAVRPHVDASAAPGVIAPTCRSWCAVADDDLSDEGRRCCLAEMMCV